ncbi:MAG TPA: acetylglutamate kinase [Polyangia bacterium]
MAVSAPGVTSRPIDAVIKLGGDVLEGKALVDVAAEIARARAGRRLLVVHGGGPQATALARRLGVEANIVGGRRITDDPMLDIMKMVVAGRLNVDLVAALRADGVPAFGVSGASGVIRAHRRPPRVVSGAGDAPIDFGLVGDIDGFDLELLDALDARDALPVLACLGADTSGTVLNINADVVASQLAGAVRAGALVACTAVGGVRRDKDDPTTRLGQLTVAEAKAAIADGTVQGGMIPKLEEAFAPLAAGVAAVHIVAPSEIATSLLAPGSVGTLLVP